MSFVDRIRTPHIPGFLSRWARDACGNYTIIFALALTPILIAIGGAIDLSQAYVVKQRMTRALDAAGLAVGGTTGMTTTQIQAMAQNYFNANYPAAKLGVPGTVSVTTSGNIVNLSVNATMPTGVMGIIGINTLNIGASSQITRMGKKLEVALVLDTTGSMAQNSKLSTLKTAAKNLISTVSAAAVNVGDVKIAIVPFAVDVNVGTGNVNASWLRWDQFGSSGGGNGYGGGGYGGGSCNLLQILLGQCNSGGGSSSHSSWTGCVMDRDQNYDISNAVPVTSSNATLYPADSDCDPVELMPLSYDWTALNDKIDSLAAAGNTNTTIGMVWGWTMLTQGDTLSNAAAPASNLDKVIVFLTDGDNTQNRFTSTQSSIDARTASLCTAIKAANVIVYTIRVMDGNDTLLRNCASDAGKYYSVTSASQLTSVFNSIAQALSNLRVSQ